MALSNLPGSPFRITRRVPRLYPEDSLTRAASLMRGDGGPLPVLDGRGRLIGVLVAEDLSSALSLPEDVRASATVRSRMRSPDAVASVQATQEQITEVLKSTGSSAVMVVDDAGLFEGRVHAADLYVNTDDAPWLGPINGMATPWGVYLSANGVQAGASNWALVVGGMVLGLMLAAAHLLMGLLLHVLEHAGVSGVLAMYLSSVPPREKELAALWSLLQLSPAVLFLVLMRTLPLAGYHAAEHQVVHAVERGEPLLAQVVQRMPRVHPRCGTNAVAALAVFIAVSQGVTWLAGTAAAGAEAAIVGAVAAVFSWRRIGAFIQQYFVTRPPTLRQVQRGIEAARELIERARRDSRYRTPFLRRLWCMALPQTAAGVAITAAGGFCLSNLLLNSLDVW